MNFQKCIIMSGFGKSGDIFYAIIYKKYCYLYLIIYRIRHWNKLECSLRMCRFHIRLVHIFTNMPFYISSSHVATANIPWTNDTTEFVCIPWDSTNEWPCLGPFIFKTWSYKQLLQLLSVAASVSQGSIYHHHYGCLKLHHLKIQQMKYQG